MHLILYTMIYLHFVSLMINLTVIGLYQLALSLFFSFCNLYSLYKWLLIIQPSFPILVHPLINTIGMITLLIIWIPWIVTSKSVALLLFNMNIYCTRIIVDTPSDIFLVNARARLSFSVSVRLKGGKPQKFTFKLTLNNLFRKIYVGSTRSVN